MAALKSFQSINLGAPANILSLAAGLAALSALLCLGSAIYSIFLGPLSKFPGPKLWALSGVPLARVTSSGKDNKVIPSLHAKYGPIVRIGPRLLSFNGGAQAFKDIYGFKRPGQPNLFKDPQFYLTPTGEPASIIQADDANHARLRKLMSHAFSDKSLRDLEPLLKRWMLKMTEKLGENSVDGQKLDMLKHYNCTTFGLNMLEDSEYSPWVKVIFDQLKFATKLRALVALHDAFATLVTILLNHPYVAKKRMEHKKYCDDRVDRRLSREPARPDLWSKILEKGKGDLTVPEQYVTASLFMIAGTETTATALSGTTFHLLSNPQYLSKLTAEVRSAFASSEDLSMDALARLKYLDAVLHEGLRMYPPVPALLPRRTPKGGAVIYGEYIPEDVCIGVHHLSTYLNPSLFKNPDEFHPERWLGDPAYADDQLAALEPFSTGPRNCVGKNLAWHEMRLLLAAVVLNFDVKLCNEARSWNQQNVYILWEKKPLWCTLTPVQTVQ